MSSEQALRERSETKCELCGSGENLSPFDIVANVSDMLEDSILACATCQTQINAPDKIVIHHWRCLNDSMWSAHAPVQIMAWRMLNRLSALGESWAQDALDMLYLDEQTLAKAQADSQEENDDIADIKHIDSNGVLIEAGDTVVLIKDLNVKGTSFTAKRGTSVRNISLVHNNAEHIEGRVNGQQIVILTKFVKKT